MLAAKNDFLSIVERLVDNKAQNDIRVSIYVLHYGTM